MIGPLLCASVYELYVDTTAIFPSPRITRTLFALKYNYNFDENFYSTIAQLLFEVSLAMQEVTLYVHQSCI